MSVNLGPVTAIRIAQAAAGVHVDGMIGPVTLAAWNNPHTKTMFMQELRSRHCNYYAGVISDVPSMVRFSLGWMRRGTQ